MNKAEQKLYAYLENLSNEVPTSRITMALDYPPSSNRYWRVYKNKVVRSDEALSYITYVQSVCNMAGIRPMLGDISVSLTVYRPQRSGDLDNRIKITLDSLQGHAYLNDSQIVEIYARRFEDKHNPRVEIVIEKVQP